MEHIRKTNRFSTTIPLMLILTMLFSGLVNADAVNPCVVTFTGRSYADNEKTSMVNPTIYFSLDCADAYTFRAVLNISGSDYGNSTSITNGTENHLTAITSLPYSVTGYTYNVYLLNDTDNTYLNATEERTLYVTRLGSIEELVKETPSLLGEIIPVVIPIAVIILFFVIIGFMTGLFDGILGKVKGGIGKI